ncbi:MAG: hypothetical protein KDN22_02460 [Verrucomicrobiae bacterium]|nr:hypothetical protein [Verrucomicrobiae bacterium]
MIRKVISLAVGAIVGFGVFQWAAGQFQSRGSLAGDSREMVSPKVPPPVAPDFPQLLAQWHAAQTGELADRIAFLETLDSERTLYLLKAAGLDQANRDSGSYLFDRLSELDHDAALTFAETLAPDQREPLVTGLLLKWASRDADACGDWIQSSGTILSRSFRDAHVAVRAEHRPTARELSSAWRALHGAEKITQMLSGSYVYSGEHIAPISPIVNEARHTGDWPGPMQRLLTIPDPNTNVLTPLVNQWMADDLDGILAWTESLPTGKARDDIIRCLFSQHRGIELFSVDVAFDMPRLYDWLKVNAPEALWEHLGNWMEVDSAAVAKWLTESDSPPALLGRYAVKLGEEDMAAALEIAAAIDDPMERNLATHRLAYHWRRIEPWLAEPWIREHFGWSDEEIVRKLGERF